MICPNCKYEYEWDWIEGKHTVLKGEQDFIELELSNQIRTYISVYSSIEDKEYVGIYICPKCGILFVRNIDYLNKLLK